MAEVESQGAAPGLDPSAAWAWLALPPADLLGQCRQSRFQGSGPGGQKRNRVYSGVRLSHAPSGLSAECVEWRESARNVEDALSRLRLALALAASEVPYPGGDPAAGQPFRVAANPGHPDYARGALRALSLLRNGGGQVAAAAAALGCTASALTRYLRAEKSVWAAARDIRIANGLHPLK
jgi:hypothetical protein